MNGASSWIEPPPAQRGLGCFAKGCLILVVFFILLALAFVAGTYFAAKYLRTEYFSIHHERMPISQASVEEEQAVRARWDAFEKAAHAHESVRIELTADDLNALIASEPKLHGNVYVTIEDSTARLQVSMPIGQTRWLNGRYLNAQCSVQSAPTRIIVEFPAGYVPPQQGSTVSRDESRPLEITEVRKQEDGQLNVFAREIMQ